MNTTIAVKEDTAMMLKQMQQKLGTTTHDETIRQLVRNARPPVNHLRGALKGVKEEFKREELDRFAR